MALRYKIYLFVAILFWCIGIFIDFIIPEFPEVVYLHPILDNFYSNVCHQTDSKLIYHNKYSTMVCARCTGIYLGALFSAILYIFVSLKDTPKIKYFIIASIPMVVDVISYNLGVYSYSKIFAFTTGILLGSIAFLYLYTGLQKLLSEREKTN